MDAYTLCEHKKTFHSAYICAAKDFISVFNFEVTPKDTQILVCCSNPFWFIATPYFTVRSRYDGLKGFQPQLLSGGATSKHYESY